LDLYLKKRRWKILLLFSAILIGLGSLLYTQWLTGNMAEEERKKVELWAEATKRMGMTEHIPDSPEFNTLSTRYYTLIYMILTQNTTIPIIIVNSQGEILDDANIEYSSNRKTAVLERELEKMKKRVDPIVLELGEGQEQYLYYRESSLLRNLRFFPVVQMLVIVLFIGIAYYAFSASRKAEQNQVWVGMSKETAHQLGTPISALMAWIEILKLKDIDETLIQEFEKDIQRLGKITERFSKIGSAPELLLTNVVEVLNNTLAYLKSRFSNKVQFESAYDENSVFEVPLNAALFSWVIENLCKNAIDAMENKHGIIALSITEKEDHLRIDISDTGKGIPKSHFKTIFQPGYSTKKRGWGLGLSLAKRIIEMYHKGKIFIKQSEIDKGTTFRIILKKRR
jgi:signal transduction histidine kinase